MAKHRLICYAMWTALVTIALAQPAAAAAGDKKSQPVPQWTYDLTKESMRPFTRDYMRAWSSQQNVLFLTPQRIAVYQVSQVPAPAPLEGRGPSGGAGNFFMDVRIFDVQDGHFVRGLRLPTNAESSAVFATRDGQWIARTGDALYVLSPDGELLASREFLRERTAPYESWQISVSPSGAEAIAVHQRIFSMPEAATGNPGKAQVDVEALDTATLQTLRTFSLDRPLPNWSAGDGFMISPDPNNNSFERQRGVLDFQGKWSPLIPAAESCRFEMTPLGNRSIAAYGCGKLAIFSETGQTQFSVKVDSAEIVQSVHGASKLLAVEVARRTPEPVAGTTFPVTFHRPTRIEVFSLIDGSAKLSLPVHSEKVYYAISSQGVLAVVEGGKLSVYRWMEAN